VLIGSLFPVTKKELTRREVFAAMLPRETVTFRAETSTRHHSLFQNKHLVLFTLF